MPCVVGVSLKLSTVPVVMVFTQLDVFTAETRTTVQVDHPNEDQITIDDLVKKEVGRRLQDEYLKPLQDVTGKAKFPHAVVSGEDHLRFQSSIPSSISQ